MNNSDSQMHTYLGDLFKRRITLRWMRYGVWAFLLMTTGCNFGPKVIPLSEQETNMGAAPSGVFSDNVTDTGVEASAVDQGIHQIKVMEVLPADKYVIMKVSEKEDVYWIAALKMPVEVGASYLYKGSVKQTFFKSETANRTFEEIYFVSEMIPFQHGMEDAGLPANMIASNGRDTLPAKSIVVTGSVRIADLVADPEKYGGLSIQVSGQCVKINTEIMGRNWVHLQDGSQNDYDLVITTTDNVEVGQIVTMTGVVGLDRDFGAGYQY